MPAVNCVVDRNVLNADTYANLEDVGLSVFATLCGRNRGVFVLNPPDGHSYGCIEFPKDFAVRAGVLGANHAIKDSNSINRAYINGTISGGDAVDLIDFFVQSVYQSTGIGVSGDTHACDVNGLAKLTCDNKKDLGLIRSVTLQGLFTPATWLTNGKALTLKQAKTFYTVEDFRDMKTMGLNTVQIPVTPEMFIEAGGEKDLLASLIQTAGDEGLNVILLLETASSKSTPELLVQAIKTATGFLSTYNNIGGIVLPSMQYVAAARASSTVMPLFIKAGEGNLPHFDYADDPFLFIAMDQSHTTSVADVASSDSLSDRNKMFYHEAVACGQRAPIEYSACWKNLPVYVFNGFNVAIDDCIHQEADTFQDFGQCDPDRFNERIDSDWWHRHRESYVARQLSSFEMGVGWSFDAWKMFDDDEDDSTSGTLDKHEKLFCLKNVAAAGLLPSLKKDNPAQLACLNGPANDFVLGDDTLSPTAGPPPDCGEGWWNSETEQCDYWIPPTPCPTQAPIPVCDGGFWSEDLQACDYCPAGTPPSTLAGVGIAGALLALVVGFFISKKFGRNNGGYTEIPTGNV